MSVTSNVIKHIKEDVKARAPNEGWESGTYEYIFTNVSDSVTVS